MKMFLLSDNSDTLTGMRLAGVEGVGVKTRDEFESGLDYVFLHDDIGILLVTEKLARKYASEISRLKLSEKRPLVVEIPDRHGSDRGSGFISEYIREAIGVKL